LKQFATWLSLTPMSVYMQRHESWVIPTIQSIHIVGIGLVIGSALMMTLRVVGWAGTDQTLLQSQNRFGPWLTGALCLLLASGILMVIGEPERELVTFSFWAKMSLVAAITLIAVFFQLGVSKHERRWEEMLARRGAIRWAAIGTFLIWACIIILGRLIAYDHVWGRLSPATKA
jgi:hypothetical protein